MKAVVYEKYGPPEVLELRNIEKPSFKENEILIKVKATVVNSADWRLRKADPFAVRLFFGLIKPKKKILGGMFSGEVEETGSEVTRFKKGDQIFGSTGMNFGAYAEYIKLPENAAITFKPGSTTHDEAAAIPFGGATALYFLKKANINKGEKILIYGASGAVGTAAIQLARYFGAEVTAVCSAANHELVKDLGAEKVIDYTKEDFSKNGNTYDIIFDTVGKSSVSSAAKVLKKNGRLILGSAGLSDMFAGMWTSLTSSKKIIGGVTNEKPETIIFLKELMEKGMLKSVIDKTYSLEQMVEAHRYVEKGHKKGNVVIRIEDNKQDSAKR